MYGTIEEGRVGHQREHATTAAAPHQLCAPAKEAHVVVREHAELALAAHVRAKVGEHRLGQRSTARRAASGPRRIAEHDQRRAVGQRLAEGSERGERVGDA